MTATAAPCGVWVRAGPTKRPRCRAWRCPFDGPARHARDDQSARLGLRIARHLSTSAALPRRPAAAGTATRWPTASSKVPGIARANGPGLSLARLLQCGSAPGASRPRRGLRQDAPQRNRPALPRLADRGATAAGHFVPVGSNGFHGRGGAGPASTSSRSSACMVSACLDAWRVTSDRWRRNGRAFEWFLGRNDLQPAALRPFHRRLPRRPACRPGKRKRRRGIDPLLPAGPPRHA